MTEKPGGDIQDGSDKVKIYSSNEKRVKFLGDVLANDASRSIFLLLAQGDLPAGKIADKTGLSLALITHHLEKMQNAGVVQVSKVSKNIKNRDMKYYRAVLAILIIPDESHDRARGSKALALSLRRVLRFFLDRNCRAVFVAGRKICGFHGTRHRADSAATTRADNTGTTRVDSIRPTCINRIRTTSTDRSGAGNSNTWLDPREGFSLRKEIGLLASCGCI